MASWSRAEQEGHGPMVAGCADATSKKQVSMHLSLSDAVPTHQILSNLENSTKGKWWLHAES